MYWIFQTLLLSLPSSNVQVAEWWSLQTLLGPMFETSWRQNSALDCIKLHCREPFIILLPLYQYDLNNVERDVKYQIIIIMSLRSG